MSEKIVKTTKKTTTSTYRTTAVVAPRSLVITRTSGKPSSGGVSSSRMTRTMTTTTRGDTGNVGFAEGAYATLTATGVNQVKTTRDQEKKDMQDLNDRFADYISKVRNTCCKLNYKPITIRLKRWQLTMHCHALNTARRHSIHNFKSFWASQY